MVNLQTALSTPLHPVNARALTPASLLTHSPSLESDQHSRPPSLPSPPLHSWQCRQREADDNAQMALKTNCISAVLDSQGLGFILVGTVCQNVGFVGQKQQPVQCFLWKYEDLGLTP